jgi:Tol biopolymer transport system component
LVSKPYAEKRLGWRLPVLIATAVVVAIALFFLGRETRPIPPQPRFHRLTFRRGSILYARFAPDGHTIVYSAKWEGSPSESYSTKPEASGSTDLGISHADTLSVSPSGEQLVVLNRRVINYWASAGTLARVPISGGTPRPILENVQDADWAPDGATFAVARFVDNECRLEYPVGKVLYRGQGWISSPRVSPDGKSVAFVDHTIFGDDQGRISFIDTSGTKHDLTESWASAEGLAWAPDGKEIWFTASDTGINSAIYAITPQGKRRLILRPPGRVVLHDISHDGQLLMTSVMARRSVSALGPRQTKERDFTYLDWTRNVALFNDGQSLLFEEQGEGGGPHYSVYIRQMDGSQPIRLGEGTAYGVSPDGKWVLTETLSNPAQLFVVPVGAGEQHQLTDDSVNHDGGAFWMPDGKHIVFNGQERGHPMRAYVLNIDGGSTPTPLEREGVVAYGASPDGKSLLFYDLTGQLFLRPISGGALRPVPKTGDLDRIAGWTSRGDSVFMYRTSDIPARIFEVNLVTGARHQVQEFMPADPAGIVNIGPIQLTPDGHHYAYGFVRVLSDLYVVDGLK